VGDKIREDRHNDETNRRAADVGDRIQRNLSAFESGGIAAQLGSQGVGALMACGGKEEDDVPDYAEHEEVGRHTGGKTKRSVDDAQDGTRARASAGKLAPGLGLEPR
jgi:hypothetical protein